MALTGKQRRFLRALGHHLRPVVQVGRAGVTESVAQALDQALEDHELVKIKLAESVEDREEAGAELARQTGGDCVQVMGRTLLVYRPRKKDPAIELPPARGQAGA